MKTVIFTEEQFQNLNQIGKDLIDDEQDPRSVAYIRKLKRPTINWLRIIQYTIIPTLVLAALVFGMKYFVFSMTTSLTIATAIFMVYIIFISKRAVICLIKIYQRYAPDSIRNKCRYEPSCSEYMILSIEKFGLVKGIKKGICRLKRCNINGGGFDYPY